MTDLSSVRPPRRPWADRLGLRLYLGDRLRWRLAQDHTPTAPAVDVQGAVLDQDMGWLEDVERS